MVGWQWHYSERWQAKAWKKQRWGWQGCSCGHWDWERNLGTHCAKCGKALVGREGAAAKTPAKAAGGGGKEDMEKLLASFAANPLLVDALRKAYEQHAEPPPEPTPAEAAKAAHSKLKEAVNKLRAAGDRAGRAAAQIANLEAKLSEAKEEFEQARTAVEEARALHEKADEVYTAALHNTAKGQAAAGETPGGRGGGGDEGEDDMDEGSGPADEAARENK